MNARLFAASILLATCAGAHAAAIVYSGNLNGAVESPPNASSGTGTTVVSYDAATHMLTVQATFSGLNGTTTMAHIHCCVPTPGSGSAGVATQVPSFTNFPLGVMAGTYSMSFDLTMASSWNAGFITANGGTTGTAEVALAAALAADKAYLNIHTSTFAAGEIRSFLTPDVVFANGFES